MNLLVMLHVKLVLMLHICFVKYPLHKCKGKISTDFHPVLSKMQCVEVTNFLLFVHLHACYILWYMSFEIILFYRYPNEFVPKKPALYSEEQKSFTLTLHLYSPKAYELVRNTVSLPTARTLRRY